VDKIFGRAQPNRPAAEIGKRLLFFVVKARRFPGRRQNDGNFGHGRTSDCPSPQASPPRGEGVEESPLSPWGRGARGEENYSPLFYNDTRNVRQFLPQLLQPLMKLPELFFLFGQV